MEEIQTPEFGAGLDGVLRDRKEDLYGILNGVDYDEWSPSKDPFIKERYGPANLKGKRACKADLQREFGLALREEIPLIGMISRLDEQKGFDLIEAIMEKLMELGPQCVLLGTGKEKYHLLLENLQKKYPQQLGVKIAFDNVLAHKIEAGADMFLMPSRYEPCGLNQIYSLKYGTVPIVRATGGLDDTIEDFNPLSAAGNGFKFRDYAASCLLEAIKRALQAYRDRPLWENLMVRGMSADFSWKRSASEYLKVYQETIEKKKAKTAVQMNTYEILSKVIDITNASVDADRRLSNLVETLALIFSVPLCALFLWDPQQARLFLKFCNRSHPVLPEGLSFSADEGPLGACARAKDPHHSRTMPRSFSWGTPASP